MLHNFLLEGSDVEVDECDVVHVSGQNNDSEPLNQGTVAGNNKRKEVMARALLFRNNPR